MLCFASTCVATLYHYALGRVAPYPWWDLPVVLGTLGGIGLIIGPLGLMIAKLRRDPAMLDEQRLGMDFAFLAMLFLTSLTGLLLLVLRDTPAMATAARAASRRGLRACSHHAVRQIRAWHLSLRRAGALRQGASGIQQGIFGMSDLTGIPCIFMRGGTSRGPYFRAADLPADTATRDRVLLAAMGSPDLRQIDGLGGADTADQQGRDRVEVDAAGRRCRLPVRAGRCRQADRRHQPVLRQHAGRRRAVRARDRNDFRAGRRDARDDLQRQHRGTHRGDRPDPRRPGQLHRRCAHRRRARHRGADRAQLHGRGRLGLRQDAADRKRRAT